MEQILTKDLTVSKIRKGSFIIAVICAVAALFDILIVFTRFGYNGLGEAVDVIDRFVILRNRLVLAVNVVKWGCGAGVFFGLYKSCKPFTHGTVTAVRFIGILSFISSVLPTIIACLSTGYTDMKVAIMQGLSLSGLGTIVNGVLFIFIAQIIHYGTLLQQESDETL